MFVKVSVGQKFLVGLSKGNVCVLMGCGNFGRVGEKGCVKYVCKSDCRTKVSCWFE